VDLIYALDIIGTFAFAVSGALVASGKELLCPIWCVCIIFYGLRC